MKDIHDIFTEFKEEFPLVNDRYESLEKKSTRKGDPCPKRYGG